ncbi:LuxR C-terminal-related transcriptional regulator [Paenibacillus koleovorans]|uniref:LuxR C-terminal-related transcriptional regulator n=1 Tax=Paenibacillus koleovorans TaxID=121608 RepID=UPI000FDB32A7|nr:LuxR C-terminal-related transcriptional regulator [Paenibacillus koleovorans]
MERSWVVTEKTTIPFSGEHTLIRRRLEHKLHESLTRTLTIMTAPAGFGKTTLTSEWISRNHLRAAWVSLKEGDDTHLWHYLVYAIHTIEPDIAQALQPVLDAYPSVSMEFVISRIVHEISLIATPFVIVLDDYHLIQHDEIHDNLHFFIMHLPPQAHLILVSRQAPPFPVSRFRTTGQLCEMNMNDLRFSLDETAELFDDCFKLELPPDDIALLCSKTEGWAAGLKFASIYLQDQEHSSQFIRKFSGSHRFVMDFLMDELLYRQPEHIRLFLLHTSVLDRFCASLCFALTENDSAFSILPVLERTNLFIVPLDQNRTWFRYHHLFAEFLRKLLEQYTTPSQLAAIHTRAYGWYSAQHMYKEAIPHALAAGAHDQVVLFMEHMFHASDRTVQSLALQDWAQKLPVAILMSRPKLFIYWIGTWVLFGKTTEALRVLNEAEQLCAREQHSWPAEVRVMLAQGIRVMRGVINISLDYTRLLEHIDDVITLMNWTGKQTEFLNPNEASLIRGHICFGGKVKKSLDLYTKLHNDPHAGKFFREHLDGLTHVMIADLHYERNELGIAREQLVHGIFLAEAANNAAVLAPALYLKARLEQADGDTESALSILHEANEHISQMPSPRWQSMLEAASVRFQIMRRSLEEGAKWAQRRLLSVTAKPIVVNEFENITFARVLMAQHKLKEATQWLTQLLQLAKSKDRYASVIEISLLLTLSWKKRGDLKSAMRMLDQAIYLAEAEQFERIFLDEGPDMADLLAYWLQVSTNKSVDEETHLRRVRYVDSLLQLLIQDLSSPKQPLATTCPQAAALLTVRELDILLKINKGATNEEIARELFLAIGTVKRYTHNLFQKLEARNRVEALSQAKKLGII